MILNDFLKFNINIIVAMENDGLIGINNNLPWEHIPEDIKYFSEITKNTIVIMGNNTWKSLPIKNRPLPNRINIILSKEQDNKDNILKNVYFCKNIIEVYELLETLEKLNKEIFVIGGSIIYELFLPICKRIYITEIDIINTSKINEVERKYIYTINNENELSKKNLNRTLENSKIINPKKEYTQPVYFLYDIDFIIKNWKLLTSSGWKPSKNKNNIYRFLLFEK